MISCSDYDYIEIVCLYQYPVQLVLTSGSSVEGKAMDTKRNSDKEECIELATQEGRQLVVLTQIKKLTVQQHNPHFLEVRFN